MRKRFLYFILFWLISNILYAETIECFPEKPKLGKFGNYSIIKNLISHSGDVGSPMIPLSSVFMKLPVNKKIANVKISFLQSESIFLDHPLIPIQQMQPLVKKTAPEFVLPSDVAYHKRVYPDNKLFKVSYGFCGSSKIGQISFYSIKYLPLQQVIEVPSKVKIEYDLVTGDSKNRKITTDNYTTSRIKQEIGLKNSKNDIQPVYLLIFPQALSSAYADLAEWRNKQGITVITETYENILSLSSGVDEQEKLRNFIIEMYQEHQISHLTLGADVSIIPSRIAFAFDCDYGLADNENDLLCDMYYGCLDGNWDANGNGIYGEDEDETDYWAEVYVSRIPAENSAQVEYYIEKLKQYEQGEIEQYEKAGGFSMQLWPGCSSEICQQFIYEIFFPQNYQIELLYGENNNEDAAYQLLNDNLNLAQHTGHGWFTSLSLENGQISHNNISNLQNEWGGIFYSIGCWTAAMDYNAIGESLVRKIDAGFLGYVGNSRYGWGAPAAPGFGFSEFFQKEFFQLLFQNNVNIFSELNYMQKIPFIPYFEGVSIYKWIGYELNALGDSYLQILIQTPLSLDVAAQSGEGEVKFWVKSNSSAVANAVVTLGEQQGYTDENGEITFPNNDGIVEVYKFGYKYFTSDLQTITSPLCLEINQGIDDDGYAQSETFQINSTLHNSSNEDIEFIVEYEFNEEELILQILGEHPAVIEANTSLELSSVQLQIKPIDSSYQMPSGKVIPLVQKIVEVNSNNILWQHNYNIKIIAPAFQMSQLEWENYDLVPGMQSDFSFKIKNIGNLVSEAVQISFTSSEDWISIADDMIELDNLPPDSSATLCNQMIISENSPPEFWVDIGLNIEVDDLYSYTESISVPNSNFGYNNNFESDFNWNGDSSWQIVDTYAYEGEYSLSCRPSDIGYYATESEYFYFLPGMELNFAYRYKMPMYGEDGFFVRLHRESKIDTLIFLGAGGALPSENGEKGYIEADWNQYNLNIQDLTTHDWERGELFKIDFLFSYPEKESGINDYYNMPEIGIFIDNFQLATTGIVDADTFPNATEKIITLYPNPFNSKLNLKIDSNNDGKVEIFNAKGQKVDEINKARNQISLHWNADHQPSGIYFIKWQDANNTVTKKCLLLK